MTKNTIIAIILSTIVFLGSVFIQQKFFPAPAQSEQTVETQSENVSENNEAKKDSGLVSIENSKAEAFEIC